MKSKAELIEKAKTAKTAEELLAKAKTENIEMTAEEAERYFAELHKTGELADEELDNVAGGCDDSCNFKYEVGNRVQFTVSGSASTHTGRIFRCYIGGGSKMYSINEESAKLSGQGLIWLRNGRSSNVSEKDIIGLRSDQNEYSY